MSSDFPERIVCLTEETTETLYLLGEDWRIVGISGFTVRPLRARQEKPIVSSFSTARIRDILDLAPDLVLGFSDIQAGIAAELIARGIEVHVFNQRSIAGIFRMIYTLGALVGCPEKSAALAGRLRASLSERAPSSPDTHRPRIYFEEWDDPMICGIRWVSELIDLAGGEDVFAELSSHSLAADRILSDPGEVVERNPDIIIGSWCGKPFEPDVVKARPDWHRVSAVRNNQVHELESSIILQPGPAALTDGLRALEQIVADWKLQQAGEG